MNYEQWLEELFEHPPDTNPVLLELSDDFYAVPPNQVFDLVDRMLVDADVHSKFSKDQLGNGINSVYSNSGSDLPFLYTTECEEDRRLEGIRNLVYLYRNYFERYCTAPVTSIGNDQTDGPMGYICYMFWDVFVLHPSNATPSMTSAAINVMRSALGSRNENCLASAIHGLGHWALDLPEAVTVLRHWLRQPTTANPEILHYARAATTGMIL